MHKNASATNNFGLTELENKTVQIVAGYFSNCLEAKNITLGNLGNLALANPMQIFSNK